MRIRKWIQLSATTILCLLMLPGCWNYREIEDLVIVSGVAIDKGEDDNFLVTVETIKVGGGREGKISSESYSITGRTIFDAARNHISLTGKKLYWSHAKIVIISEDLAKEGIIRFLDWFQRDSETRADIKIIISKEKTAKEILYGKKGHTGIKTLELEEMVSNQSFLSKAPDVEIWRVINDIYAPGISAILPTVELRKDTPKNMGTAIFKTDQLIGFLDSLQSQTLLFILDEIKGGILIYEKNGVPVSMEIFKSKTKIKPIIKNDNIEFRIKIETNFGLDEIVGSEDYLEKANRKQLEKELEEMINNRVEKFVEFVQSEYGTDIFGFGEKIREEHPKKWKQLEKTWEEQFKELEVTVSSTVQIKNSGMVAEPLKMGD